MKSIKPLTFVVLLALVVPAFAGKRHKGGTGPQQQQEQQAPPVPTGPQSPSARLSQFTAAHLDHIFGPIDQSVTLPRTELSQLHASFVDQNAKAPDAEKAQYQSAIVVSDALTSAMDEREKASASAHASANAPVVQDVHDAVVSLPRHGRGSGKAANAAVHQQQNENQQNQNKASQKSAFLGSVHARQWTDRGVILRQQIQQLSERQLAA